MNYILFKADGSINEKNLAYYIQQGNTGVDTIFVSKADIEDEGSYTCQAFFKLPNGTTNTLAGVWTASVEYKTGVFANGWMITLTTNQTTYNGLLQMSVSLLLSSSNLLTYPVALVINETGYRPDEDSGVTIEEINSYLVQLQTYQLKYDLANVRGYNTLALATADLPNLADGQIVIIRDSGSSIYQVQSGSLVELIAKKAERDSLGNVIKDSYVSAVYPTYNSTTDKLFIETYSVRDDLLANNEVILPKATTTKNGLMAKEDKAKVDGLPTTYETIVNSDAKIKNTGAFANIQDMFNSAVANVMCTANLFTGGVPSNEQHYFLLYSSTQLIDIRGIGIRIYQKSLGTWSLYGTYALTKDVGASLSLNSTNFVLALKNSDGITLSSVDLPLESVVVSGSYDDDTQSLILTLQNGNTITIPVADLVNGLVPNTRTIAGVDLADDITKPELVEALCDGSLSSTSNNPVKNKVISKVLDVDQKYYSVGEHTNDNAPAGTMNTIASWGLTFNKADLYGKDINKVKVRLACLDANTTFPRTIKLKVYNTSFASATNLGTNTTLNAPIFSKDFVMTQSPQDFEIDCPVSNGDLSTVFAIVFKDMSNDGTTNLSGLYLTNCDKTGDLANKNGGVTAYYSDASNYLRFSGNTYADYCNKYMELGYVTLDMVKSEDLDGYIKKDEIGMEIVENPNIWNKNEEVLHSWASPSNGEIQVYPDNQYINGYLRSGYIPVKKNTEYIFSIFNDVNAGGNMFICFYNSNKIFMSSISRNSLEHINGQTFTTPDNDNVAYAIISFNQIGCLPVQVEEGDTATPYQEYTGVKYTMDKLVITSDQIIDADTPESYINLPNELYAVVGDTFDIFYKGILNLKSYDNMYVQCICDIGKSYQRKFELTPTASQIGNHTLIIQVYDNNKVLIDSKTINLKVVAKATSPVSNKNILCMGDSLTEGGVWVGELHRRINLTTSDAIYGESAPTGLGLTNITFVGKRQTANGAGFEGFGGWKFSTYLNPATSTDDYWISSDGHDKTNDDQESVWQASNGTQWQLETIETNRIKVKKYSGSGVLPASGTLAWVSGGIHTGNIIYTSSSLAEGNPFSYNGEIDFEAYCADLGISTIDEVYILLGWNDVGTALSTYKTQAKQFIDLLRAFNPSIKVILMGLEIPAADGMANNYDANSLYNYYKGQKFVFDLNNLYQEIASEYDSGVSFMNISSQFDTEYCMQTMQTTPNPRVSTEITIQSNGVHPAISGYYQIADVVYRWYNGNS